MLGPGEPNKSTSGLGRAAHEIAQHLAKHSFLTIIQPDDPALFDHIDNPVTTKEELASLDFSDFNVMAEISKVTIENSISPYWSSQDVIEKNDAEVESFAIRNQLNNLSEDIVAATEKMDFDIIYAHDWITFRAAIDLKKKLQKPLILHVHSLDYDRSCANGDSWVFDLEKEAFEHADAIICVSNYTKQIIQDIYQVEPSKLQVIHNGVEVQSVTKQNNPFKEKIVLFVGRLTGQKGPTNFLKIAEKVHEKYPNSRFVVAGQGDLYNTLITASAHSSMADKIHLTGQLESNDLHKLYAMSDIYCMPSISEPFGLTALEAAAAGLPLVLSSNSGAAEILNTLVSDFDDIENFANQLVHLLSNETEAKQQIEANASILENQTWKKTSTEVINIINAI